jgi:hypothetical protein
MKRHEEKLDEKPTVYLILHPVAPFGVHGAYSTEAKLEAEMKRLAKLPENRLTKSMKAYNKKYNKNDPFIGLKPKPYEDPMDRYSIYEVPLQ